MKVSVITAVRNEARSIGYTLSSVASQSYPNIEHIVIDGASTDGTIELVRAQDQQLSRLVSEPDSGVYDAFNKGLTHSTGDIVGYLNAGDEYTSSDVIQTIVDEFNAKSVGAVFGDLVIVDPVDRAKIVRRYSSSWFSLSRVRFGFMPAHPTLFIRKDVYDRWGGYDTSFRIAGDFELVARLFVRHQVPYSYLPQVLVRMPSGGLSTSGLRANWIITSEMCRACSNNDIKTSLIRLLLRFPIKLTSLTLGSRK